MAGSVAGPGVLSFRLPASPPSMNSIYNVMFGLKRIELKPEVRLYKNNMKMYVPSWDLKPEEKVQAELEVVQQWHFKNGNFKKADVQNVVKVILDLICERQGWDDSQVWSFMAKKKQSETESCVNVVLRRIPDVAK